MGRNGGPGRPRTVPWAAPCKGTRRGILCRSSTAARRRTVSCGGGRTHTPKWHLDADRLVWDVGGSPTLATRGAGAHSRFLVYMTKSGDSGGGLSATVGKTGLSTDPDRPRLTWEVYRAPWPALSGRIRTGWWLVAGGTGRASFDAGAALVKCTYRLMERARRRLLAASGGVRWLRYRITGEGLLGFPNEIFLARKSEEEAKISTGPGDIATRRRSFALITNARESPPAELREVTDGRGGTRAALWGCRGRKVVRAQARPSPRPAYRVPIHPAARRQGP